MLSLIPMAEPESEQHVERKVVYETVSASTTKNSAVGWVIIAVVAVALIAFILTKVM